MYGGRVTPNTGSPPRSYYGPSGGVGGGGAPDLSQAVDRIRQYAFRGATATRSAGSARGFGAPSWGPAATNAELDQSLGASTIAGGNTSASFQRQPAAASGSWAPAGSGDGSFRLDGSILKSSIKQPGGGGAGNTQAPVLDPADQSRENFAAVLAFLRRRYGDDDCTGPLGALSDDDVDGLVECFADDLRRSVAKARVNSSVGIVTSSGDSKTVTTPRGHDLPSTPTGSRRSGAANSAGPSSDASAAAAAAGASGAPHPVPTNIRDGMALLREGTRCVKFSARRGKPAFRYVRVQSRRALIDGDMVPAPHFCWSAEANEEAPGQLSLLELHDLETGPSVGMKRNDAGAIVGPLGDPVPDRCILSLVFRTRRLDLGFATEPEARAWEKALWFVIHKNRRMAAQGGA